MEIKQKKVNGKVTLKIFKRSAKKQVRCCGRLMSPAALLFL